MLNKILNELYELKYNVNNFGSMKHEDSVKAILSKYLTEIDIKNPKINLLKQNKNKKIEELANENIFVYQPFGKQKDPDFIICINGFVVWIECKSGKKKITWNSGFPKNDVLYLFSCKIKNTTTLFYGQNTLLLKNNPNFEENYNYFDKMLKKLCAKYFKDLFKSLEGVFDFYMRRMLIDKTIYSDIKLRDDNFNFVINLLKEKGEL
ncbi:MAG: hypothetical protein M0R46_10315 [Candidatus Muirbacterium halophilum]|nr:hypothetical protein [Candidatus Muirbacterium halophilum]